MTSFATTLLMIVGAAAGSVVVASLVWLVAGWAGVVAWFAIGIGLSTWAGWWLHTWDDREQWPRRHP